MMARLAHRGMHTGARRLARRGLRSAALAGGGRHPRTPVRQQEVWDEHGLKEAWRQIQERVCGEREKEGADADQDGGDPDGETELDVIQARSEDE